MKGIMFNLLEKFICEKFDEELWPEVVSKASLIHQDEFDFPITYADEDFKSLLVSSQKVLDMQGGDLLRMFGSFSYPHLKKKFPQYFEDKNSSFEVFKILNDVIHQEVLKSLPESYLPNIHVIEEASENLELIYQSRRKLCDFLEGVIITCGRDFDEELTLTHHHCMHYGHDHCAIRVSRVKKR